MVWLPKFVLCINNFALITCMVHTHKNLTYPGMHISMCLQMGFYSMCALLLSCLKMAFSAYLHVRQLIVKAYPSM